MIQTWKGHIGKQADLLLEGVAKEELDVLIEGHTEESSMHSGDLAIIKVGPPEGSAW